MTEHDDRENATSENGRETHGGILFRLGMFLLAAILLLCIFLVGGSLSRITSEGTIAGENVPSLTVAGFGVEVNEDDTYYVREENYGENKVKMY